LTGAKTVDTTKTEFYYSFPKRNLFTLPETIKVTEGIATIKTAFAATWNTNYTDLPVFIDNDSTNSTETKTFSNESILWAVANNTTTSWLYATSTGKVVKKYLVDYDLDQIIDIADTGATTTTTTA